MTTADMNAQNANGAAAQTTAARHRAARSDAGVDRPGLRRTTGALFLIVALASTGLAAVLAATFGWPGILREPVAIVLRDFSSGGTTVIVTWFATGWAYALLLVPILLVPTVLHRTHDPMLRVATVLGAVAVVLGLIGYLRWAVVVPALAEAYATGSEATRAAVEAAFVTQQQFGGVLLGDHLGPVLALAWSVLLSVVIMRTRVLPRWLGIAGLIAGALYLLNQVEIIATLTSDDFVAWELGAVVGSAAWGLWVAALGVTLLVHPITATSGSDEDRASADVDETGMTEVGAEEADGAEAREPSQQSRRDTVTD